VSRTRQGATCTWRAAKPWGVGLRFRGPGHGRRFERNASVTLAPVSKEVTGALPLRGTGGGKRFQFSVTPCTDREVLNGGLNFSFEIRREYREVFFD